MNFDILEQEAHTITHAKALAEIRRENAKRRDVYTRLVTNNVLQTEKLAPQYRATHAIQIILSEMTDKEFQRLIHRHLQKQKALQNQTTLF